MRYIRTVAIFITAALACAQSRDEIIRDGNPEKALWRIIKRGLTEDDAARFFEATVKDALLPSGVEGVPMFHAIVVSSDEPDHPKLIVLAIKGEKAAEVTIRIGGGRLQFPLPEGSPVRFKGVAKSFNRDPFMLTLEAGPGDVIREK